MRAGRGQSGGAAARSARRAQKGAARPPRGRGDGAFGAVIGGKGRETVAWGSSAADGAFGESLGEAVGGMRASERPVAYV